MFTGLTAAQTILTGVTAAALAVASAGIAQAIFGAVTYVIGKLGLNAVLSAVLGGAISDAGAILLVTGMPLKV